MKKKTAFFALASAASAIAIGVLYSEFIFSLVTRRRAPIVERILGHEDENRNVDDIVAIKRQELLDNCPDRITISSYDDLTLVGHRYPANEPKRIILAMHGWHSSWNRDFGMISQFLSDSGCSVLFAEQRGHGESHGEYISYGIEERLDTQSWVTYISENNPSNLPVYLYGVSMGAATVLMSSNLPMACKISGIIADCGYTAPEDIIKNTAEITGIPAGRTYDVLKRNCFSRLGFDLSDYFIPDIMRENTTPTLFIHGDADTFVPVEMSYDNYSSCAGPRELLIVNGADHAKSYMTAPELYEEKVLSFFDKYQ